MEYLIKILTGSLFPLLLTPQVSASSRPPPRATPPHSAASALLPSSLPSASSENINQLCSTTDATLFSYSRLFSCNRDSLSASAWRLVSLNWPDKAERPRCLLESWGWARPGGTGLRWGWRTRRMSGTSGSEGCPDRCPRQRTHSGGTFYSQTCEERMSQN